MYWQDQYKDNKLLWGEGPSELGIIVVDYLKGRGLRTEQLKILDIGCGYGRDIKYFLDSLDCTITGIDNSEKAIDIALNGIGESQRQFIELRCCDYRSIYGDDYDIVVASNFYQLLKADERLQFRAVVREKLRENGLLFLSTLSVNDYEHRGKGRVVTTESNSYQDEVFVHLCTREELTDDFSYLAIEKLYEHEYYEPRSTGETHHHISWIVIARQDSAG